MTIVFMGTPDFAVPCLQRLLEDGHTVPLVVTQADKPKGRGHKLMPPPIKVFAEEHGLAVFQPDTLRNSQACETIAACHPDLIVVVAYGKILPQVVLDVPRFGCINVHGSLLPLYRGAAPIQRAVLDGRTETGVTTMFMDAGLDTGDMLLTAHYPIGKDMTSGELSEALSLLGADTLSETLKQLQDGTLKRIAQTDEDTCYASMLDKSLSPLDFSKPAQQLHNQVRGLNPWPSASVVFENKILKVYRTRLGASCDTPPGQVIALDPVTVSCGEGTSLILCEVQYEGGKRLPAGEFFRGHPLTLNQSFSSLNTDWERGMC